MKIKVLLHSLNKLGFLVVAILYILVGIPALCISFYKSVKSLITDFVNNYEQATMYAVVILFFIICFLGFYL